MKKYEILTCPFCGNTPNLETEPDGQFYVKCPNDKCPAGSIEADGETGFAAMSWPTLEEAIAAWGKRVEPKKVPLDLPKNVYDSLL